MSPKPKKKWNDVAADVIYFGALGVFWALIGLAIVAIVYSEYGTKGILVTIVILSVIIAARFYLKDKADELGQPLEDFVSKLIANLILRILRLIGFGLMITASLLAIGSLFSWLKDAQWELISTGYVISYPYAKSSFLGLNQLLNYLLDAPFFVTASVIGFLLSRIEIEPTD